MLVPFPMLMIFGLFKSSTVQRILFIGHTSKTVGFFFFFFTQLGSFCCLPSNCVLQCLGNSERIHRAKRETRNMSPDEDDSPDTIAFEEKWKSTMQAARNISISLLNRIICLTTFNIVSMLLQTAKLFKVSNTFCPVGDFLGCLLLVVGAN